MLCVQPTGPVPTAIEWYNPQGQLVSRDGGDQVNQAGAGSTAAFLNFPSYQQSQGGRYECRVTGPGDYSEKLPVCIGECYTLGDCRLCIKNGRGCWWSGAKAQDQDPVIMGCPKLKPRPWQQFFSDSTPLTTNTAH